VTVVHGLRLWLVLLALGVEVSVRQGLALGAAAPLAAAAGVFPSGLGLAEALTAVIAPIVALPAAAGFAATALGPHRRAARHRPRWRWRSVSRICGAVPASSTPGTQAEQAEEA
jgi:hypothetical protein